MKKLLFIAAVVLALVLVFRPGPDALSAPVPFHSEQELAWYYSRGLSQDSSAMFLGSGKCVSCHGHDTAGVASLTLNGYDINVVDDWRATMMANSAKDPFWRAKVSHEVLVRPAAQSAIETKCTSCHAPLGHFTAMHAGQSAYAFQEAISDSLALDGVSCLACHKQQPEAVGSEFSGHLHFDTARVAYGPYPSPLSSPMLNDINYAPVYDAYTTESKTCAGCHTLITETLNSAGQPTGNSFVEQATYHEWLNSDYNGTQSCQGCHLPRHNGPVVVSAGQSSLPPRFFFGKHHLVGGNTFMLSMLRNLRDSLGIDATAAQFDTVLARTRNQLQHRTVELDVSLQNRTTDTAYYTVDLTNLAGHKFPSGYPSRRAWIQFVLETEMGDTLFTSGLLNIHYWIIGHDLDYERHHQVIRQPDEVQIYEQVMARASGQPTTVLLSADHLLKDNRLVPRGFSTSHPVYDTTLLAGSVLADADFNHQNGIEGSGTDRVHYHIPTVGYQGPLIARVRVAYQPVPPRWNTSMFSQTGNAHINNFRNLFLHQDASPEILADTVLNSQPLAVQALKNSQLAVWPRATTGAPLSLRTGGELATVRVFALNGALVQSVSVSDGATIELPAAAGTYLLDVQTPTERSVFKVLRY